MTRIQSKTVMLYATVDTFVAESGAAAFALELGEALGAGLTGFLLSLDANAPPPEQGSGLAAMETVFAQRATLNQANAERFRADAAKRGLEVEAVTSLDHSRGAVSCIADHARLHDVIVTGADGRGHMSDRMVAQDLLFQTGRPQIVVPTAWRGSFAGRRIVVAWDNSPVAARALFDALVLLPEVEVVHLLTIGGEKAIHSALAADVTAQMLSRRGISFHAVERALQGRPVGTAMQDAAIELGAEMLVMGGYAHSRLRDLVLGGATLSVMADPRLPVLLSH